MKKLLTLFAFPALLCLMPLTAWAQTQTVLNVVKRTAHIVRTSTLYVGEVVLDGQQSFCYLYSDDITYSTTVLGAVKYSLSDFKDGAYSALVPSVVGDMGDFGVAVCSNSAYESFMNADWTSAENAGQACFSNVTVTSASSENLYETNPDFAAKCIGDFDDVDDFVDEAGESVAINGVLGKLSATNTDIVTYTVIDGKLVKHIDRTVDYTCESVTVIYTKVELESGSTSNVLGDVDGDGTVSVTDVAWIVNHILGVNDNNFIAANADINGDGEIDINDVMATVSIILKGEVVNICPDDNHPHMIDLGLPSGTKWACCNVGAEKPEDYGGYYAWGETEEKDNYSWGTYIHCDGDENTCNNLYDIAGTQFDVAHLKWGGSWMMPSRYQTDELFNYCTHTWTTINGVYGRLFTGTNNNNIFIPAAGYRADDTLVLNDICGFYWTSSQLQTDMNIAVSFYFDYNYTYSSYINSRNLGLPVRPAQIP